MSRRCKATIPHLVGISATLFALLFARTQRCGAQALPTATGPGSHVSVGATASIYEADYGRRLLGGGAIYADTNLTWRFGIEAEARTLRYHTEAGVRESTFMIGPRVTLRPSGFMPYAKLVVGLGTLQYPYHYGYGCYFVFAPGAGIDRSLGSRVTLRLVDVEYQDWPQFTYGQLHPYGVSAGISFRLTQGSRYPTNLNLRLH